MPLTDELCRTWPCWQQWTVRHAYLFLSSSIERLGWLPGPLFCHCQMGSRTGGSGTAECWIKDDGARCMAIVMGTKGDTAVLHILGDRAGDRWFVRFVRVC